MTVINWNPLVNQRFFLDGEYGYKSDNITTLTFESGKERITLKNSFIPREYPSVSLALDNIAPIATGRENTEFKQFMRWFEVGLRYGILPFYAPKIGYPGETGIYQFIPNTLKYDRIYGIVNVTFGLREVAS